MTTFAARRCVVMTGAPWNAPAAQKAVASRKNRATMSRASATQIEVGKCLELSEGRSKRKRARPQRVQPWPAPPRGCCIASRVHVEPLLLEAARLSGWRSARAQRALSSPAYSFEEDVRLFLPTTGHGAPSALPARRVPRLRLGLRRSAVARRRPAAFLGGLLCHVRRTGVLVLQKCVVCKKCQQQRLSLVVGIFDGLAAKGARALPALP